MTAERGPSAREPCGNVAHRRFSWVTLTNRRCSKMYLAFYSTFPRLFRALLPPAISAA
jgi:hypothetical protein